MSKPRSLPVVGIGWSGSIDLTVRCPFCKSPFKTQISYQQRKRMCPACHAVLEMSVTGVAQKM